MSDLARDSKSQRVDLTWLLAEVTSDEEVL